MPQRKTVLPKLRLSSQCELVGQGDIVAGTDECSRGTLFGPVYACSVVLDDRQAKKLIPLGIGDSKEVLKQISESSFHALAEEIKSVAVAYAIAEVSLPEVNATNTSAASLEAMRRSVHALSIRPTFVFVDGDTKIPRLGIPQYCFKAGDKLWAAIAAASIVGKSHQIKEMRKFSEQYPEYALDKNHGYGTNSHRQAIAVFGITKLHRSYAWRSAQKLLNQAI